MINIGKFNPHCIIVDYQLPGLLNGIELYNQISKKLNTDISGILVSGTTSPTAMDQFKKSGLIHMTKPISAIELKENIEALLKSTQFKKS